MSRSIAGFRRNNVSTEPASPVPISRDEHIFYDGTCGVCHWAVGLVARHDPEGRTFRFAPLGGETFVAALDESLRRELPDSMLVHTDDGRLLMRTTGVVHILKRLGGPWRALGTLLWLVPRPLRDFGYDLFARYRKRFVRTPEGTCPILPPPLRGRFDP